VKFLGRHKGGAIRDGVLLSAANWLRRLPRSVVLRRR
jgi:hypothetical protein